MSDSELNDSFGRTLSYLIGWSVSTLVTGLPLKPPNIYLTVTDSFLLF